jgi:hypothetical protein
MQDKDKQRQKKKKSKKTKTLTTKKMFNTVPPIIVVSNIATWWRICSACRNHNTVLPHSWRIIGFATKVTRRVPLLKQEPSSFSRVCVAEYLVFCVVFWRSLFILFHLAIVLSILRFTASDYPPLVSPKVSKYPQYASCALSLIYTFFNDIQYIIVCIPQ